MRCSGLLWGAIHCGPWGRGTAGGWMTRSHGVGLLQGAPLFLIWLGSAVCVIFSIFVPTMNPSRTPSIAGLLWLWLSGSFACNALSAAVKLTTGSAQRALLS